MWHYLSIKKYIQSAFIKHLHFFKVRTVTVWRGIQKIKCNGKMSRFKVGAMNENQFFFYWIALDPTSLGTTGPEDVLMVPSLSGARTYEAQVCRRWRCCRSTLLRPVWSATRVWCHYLQLASAESTSVVKWQPWQSPTARIQSWQPTNGSPRKVSAASERQRFLAAVTSVTPGTSGFIRAQRSSRDLLRMWNALRTLNWIFHILGTMFHTAQVKSDRDGLKGPEFFDPAFSSPINAIPSWE